MSTKERLTRRVFLNGIRLFNKYILNRFTLWLAKRGIGPFSSLTHKGRKSNRLYSTPVVATYIDEHIFIPLSYGEQVDWLRNVLAQDGCKISWKGSAFEAKQPVVLEAHLVFPLLPRNRRTTFERFGLEKFLRLTRGQD